MTTLFNLFCPLVLETINNSLLLLFLFGYFVLIVMLMWSHKASMKFNVFSGSDVGWFISGFVLISYLNLLSLVCYGYPVTTTFTLNYGVAMILWSSSLMLGVFKLKAPSAWMPVNTPWYLVPFLALIEAISNLVRPITLCFRLLANMAAGHILLSLICKMTYNTWMLGILFMSLELMVAVVQAFVFMMLCSVYFNEVFTH